MVAEATVDAYGEDEQLTGLYTLIEENLTVPFPAMVLGAQVDVRRLELRDSDIAAVCVQGKHRQLLGLLDLEPPVPAPPGWEWVSAYRHWAGHG